MRRRGRRALLAIALVVVLAGLPALEISTWAQQTAEVFSPASGHAEVIAQGVTTLPGQASWRVVFHSIDPGNQVNLTAEGPGFVLVDTGGLVVDDGSGPVNLAPSEAAFRGASSAQVVPVGDRPAGLFAIDLVPPDAADAADGGIPVYASATFQTPGGVRDLDLVRDLLDPGESTTVIGNQAPVVVLVTLGALRADASDGSSASLQVGEAGTFNGDIVLTADSQAPTSFVAAVIGREVPLAAGTPGSTPVAATSGTVQLTVYACPPAVSPEQASSSTCLPDREAAALRLATGGGTSNQDVGPSTEQNGLPTWTGLPAGNYVLQATEFKQGFGRFFVPGLTGVDERGTQGYSAGDGGYGITIGAEKSDYPLEVFVFAPAAGGTPQAQQATTPPSTPAAQSPTPAPSQTPSVIEVATEEATAAPTQPAGPTEIPSVIEVETAVPGTELTPTATSGATATPRATERAIVSSTAVARPRRGSVDIRVWGCQATVDSFDPAKCAQAATGFGVQLTGENGDVIAMDQATVGSDGTVSWENVPFGTYLLQQPQLLPGTDAYYVPDLPLNNDGTGYVLTLDANSPVATLDMYGLQPSATEPTPASTETVDTDQDGITDADESSLYGTDPTIADTDGDGVLDGQEVANGTDPLTADQSVEPAGDADGDGLLDGDEAAYGTDPNNADTDGDGWLDLDEINIGTDPLDPNSVPVG
jgi:hypothetical protein